MHADILIVDDNHEAAELLRDLLELNGHSVRVALDGAQAIALMRAQPALLLLVDQRLPDMLGAELVPQLKGIALAAGLPGCIAIGITGLNAAEARLPGRLRSRARQAAEFRHLRRARRALARQPAPTPRGLTSASPQPSAQPAPRQGRVHSSGA